MDHKLISEKADSVRKGLLQSLEDSLKSAQRGLDLLKETEDAMVAYADFTTTITRMEYEELLMYKKLWEVVEKSPSQVTVMIHNLRPDQRKDYVMKQLTK